MILSSRNITKNLIKTISFKNFMWIFMGFLHCKYMNQSCVSYHIFDLIFNMLYDEN